MTKYSKKDADLACDGVFYRLSSLGEYRSIAPKVRRKLKGLAFLRLPYEIEQQLRDAEKLATTQIMSCVAGPSAAILGKTLV